jgi:hypothetical protein
MRKIQQRILLVLTSSLLLVAGFMAGSHRATVAYAAPPAQTSEVAAPTQGSVPKAYGRLVAGIADQIGTGLVFEDPEGVIRFVSVNGMKEGELARYDKTPTHGGIPKSYGHLVTAVVNPEGTALVFEDSAGTIRFVTVAGVKESELTRD